MAVVAASFTGERLTGLLRIAGTVGQRAAAGKRAHVLTRDAPALGSGGEASCTGSSTSSMAFRHLIMKKKRDLPTKLCKTCGRPFVWRRKWADVWDEVQYCSVRCRAERARRR
ncbi:DUF2256 domain-containing protein [Rhodophyticola sp.]|uniref:DUF2256 domain-containing protein n=1 Tax=Rhodophyticola sp. TaxID=2680032 RepID=UPI003D2BE6D1